MTAQDANIQRLETLNAIGAALSSEPDLASLLERILEAARDFAHADGGTLYRVDKDRLVFEVLRNDTLGRRMGGKTGQPIDFAPIPMYLPDGGANDTMVVVHAALTGQTVNIPDAYAAQGYDFSGTRAFDAKTGYHSQSFLTVPMKDHSGAVIGVLQLINAKNPDGSVRAFSIDDQQLVESLASQAAIALNNRRLIEQLESLFIALINLINTAIDEKSPYTAGHCQRVPELTMMLAEAAAWNNTGPLAGFHMSEADRYELKIAGLLHDCGKITTPVHVVDKATKLETIFDRIALVDTRFEVLLRDAQIALLKGTITQHEHDEWVRRLVAERALVRASNTGGEFMKDEAIAAIRTMGQQTWRDHDGVERPLLSAEEIMNLTIRRGTLNDAEREIINRHINLTIDMLESLPWPAHLTRVPEFAGGHHERMDGRGYPKGLVREQMSVQARVMGIADIFEALTARDRPYKPAKTLSESLTILGRMKDDNHVDADLFDVFIRERVFLDYARRFLDADKIDLHAIDWRKMPGLSAELAEHMARTEADARS
ncbi:MAG TPA: HD domain-containing phosphohydrolase [Xanthomonadaceae bacterium]|jgi:HD-GYP domain-containing protein (c-di-GMP phosphodiesterase class II)